MKTANILFQKIHYTDGCGLALGIFYSKRKTIEFVKKNYPTFKRKDSKKKDVLYWEDNNSCQGRGEHIYMDMDYKIPVIN